MDFNDALAGHKMKRLQEQWMQAYFTACMMSVHLKNGISAAELMEPLENTGESNGEKATAFFSGFDRQRKELEDAKHTNRD